MASLHRVGLGVYEWNTTALEVYEKIGLVTEGKDREALWYRGRWWDIIHMSMLDYEWDRLQQKDTK
jgi:RimJ/RimL family protein N-acetyltransferase